MQVVDAPTANVVDGQLIADIVPAPPWVNASVTPTLVSAAEPVFVTTNEYVTV